MSPRTSIVTRSSAAAEPLALANGATPVVSVTLNGPSTRTLVKPVMPKLRVAASAGAASVSDDGRSEKEGAHEPTFHAHG